VTDNLHNYHCEILRSSITSLEHFMSRICVPPCPERKPWCMDISINTHTAKHNGMNGFGSLCQFFANSQLEGNKYTRIRIEYYRDLLVCPFWHNAVKLGPDTEQLCCRMSVPGEWITGCRMRNK
jgi:hypothetical protein